MSNNNKTGSGPNTVGQMLAEQRQKLGLSIGDCAESLKISSHKVEALEAGDDSPFVSEIFIRGYLKNYAKLLDISEADLMYYYEVQQQDSQTPKQSDHHAAKSGAHWWLPYFVGVFVIAVWFFVSTYPDTAPSETESATLPAAVAPPLESSPASVEDTPLVKSEEATVATPVEPPGIIEREAATAVELIVSAEPPPPAPVIEESPVILLDTLEFSFTEECWVEVVDANKEVVASDLELPDSTLSVQGVAPFSILLGNAKAVTLLFNGEPVALNVANSSARTLRLTLGE